MTHRSPHHPPLLHKLIHPIHYARRRRQHRVWSDRVGQMNFYLTLDGAKFIEGQLEAYRAAVKKLQELKQNDSEKETQP